MLVSFNNVLAATVKVLIMKYLVPCKHVHLCLRDVCYGPEPPGHPQGFSPPRSGTPVSSSSTLNSDDLSNQQDTAEIRVCFFQG